MPTDFHQLEWSAAIEDDLRQLVRLAVREDLDRFHDWTTLALVGADQQGRAAVVVREAGVIAGLRAVPVLIDEMHAAIEFSAKVVDGNEVTPGHRRCRALGLRSRHARLRTAALESARPPLGHRHAHSRVRPPNRRHRGPHLRHPQNDARLATAGEICRPLRRWSQSSHRPLRRDPHQGQPSRARRSRGSLARRSRSPCPNFLEQSARERPGEPLLVEVEIDNLDQLDDVLRAAPDIMLLDNMSPAALAEAVRRRNALAPKIELEASGGVTLETIREIALSGVERISVGALTHSAPVSRRRARLASRNCEVTGPTTTVRNICFGNANLAAIDVAFVQHGAPRQAGNTSISSDPAGLFSHHLTARRRVVGLLGSAPLGRGVGSRRGGSSWELEGTPPRHFFCPEPGFVNRPCPTKRRKKLR